MLKEKFTSRLRIIRAEKGLSQENLAAMLKMSTNGYSKIERGETDVSISKIELIAEVLEVDIADLLQLSAVNTYINNNGTASVVSSNASGTFHINEESRVILELFERIKQLEEKIRCD